MMRSAAGLDRLSGVGYTGRVRLRGALGERLEGAAEFYAGLPVDDVLHGFRVRAGLPSRGHPLGGWARETSEMTFGQWVSGLARMSAVLGRADLAERASVLLDGYFGALGDRRSTGMTLYSWEKLVCGVVDLTVYGNDDSAVQRLPGLVERLPSLSGTMDATPEYFMGSSSPDATEWYTVAENLYRGGLTLGDEGVLDEAARFHYPGFWDRFADPAQSDGGWDVPGYLHAYSHLNTFASAAMVFEVHRDPAMLTVLRQAYAWATTTQCFATGGYGPREFTVADDGSLGRSLEWTPDSAEIICGTWAAFKFSTALLRFTGEAHYADWAERLVYNVVASCLRPQPDGRSPYYDDYRLGSAAKLPYPEAWPCCSGSYAQVMPHVADLIYFEAPGEISIALYLPSELLLAEPLGGRLVMSGEVPADPEVEVRVELPGSPQDFDVRLRIPPWAATMAVSVNGEVVHPAEDLGWMRLRRVWRNGDRVRVRFTPRLRLESVDRAHPHRAAVVFGPVVLAQEVMDAWPFTLAGPSDRMDLDDHLERLAGEELEFRPTAPGSARMPPGVFRPLSRFPERRPYRVYHDLQELRLI